MILTLEQHLEEHHFFEASHLLIEREELLFQKITEAEEVKKLTEDRRVLEDHIFQTLQQSLTLAQGKVSTEALTSAVKAIYQEDEQDQLWKQRDQTPPGWRPCGWRERHDATLRRLVKDRLDNPSVPPANQVKQSSVKAHVCSMGRQLKEDLLSVVEIVKTCYPPEMDICNFYARMYHQILSNRLRKIADFGLDDKDCVFLLSWVNDYYPG